MSKRLKLPKTELCSKSAKASQTEISNCRARDRVILKKASDLICLKHMHKMIEDILVSQAWAYAEGHAENFIVVHFKVGD